MLACGDWLSSALTWLSRLAENNLLQPPSKTEQFPMATGSFSIAFFWMTILFQPGGCICALANDLSRKRNIYALVTAHSP